MDLSSTSLRIGLASCRLSCYTPSVPKKRTTLTPNQIVAANLARARAFRGWTQEEASEHLAPYLGGERWSKASWSAAERSVDGLRPREFTADEIVAFSQCFELPLAWWFLPSGTTSFEVMLLGAQLGSRGGQEEFESRLTELLTRLGLPGTQLAQRSWDRVISRLAERQNKVEQAQFRESLRSLVDALESTEEQGTEKGDQQ